MELTAKQQAGLNLAVQKFKNHEKYMVISGYAGTGKSTLVRFIIEALDPEPDKVVYATFTGKAAEVLRRKGNKNAMTLHKLLYETYPLPSGGFKRKPKLSLSPYTIVVVDEVSMVPKSMIDMLLGYKVFVIFLGDPFQLPMIDKGQSHNLLEKPDVFLDEIMRQAAESEIIQLTMKIRAGESFGYMKGKEVQIFQPDELSTGMLTWADQIICAKNITRHSLNEQIRELNGYTGLIQEGEKVIVKRNYWEECNMEGDALVNGSTGILQHWREDVLTVPANVKISQRRIPIIRADFKPEVGSAFRNIAFDKNFLVKEEPVFDWRTEYQLNRIKRQSLGTIDLIPKQMTYGYAITCHCAQGSEWDKVLVVEENFPFDKTEHARWLYTACTRAADKLVLIR